MPSSKWRSERSGPNWLMDEQGRLIGYRDELGNEYKMPNEPAAGGISDNDEPSSSVSGGGFLATTNIAALKSFAPVLAGATSSEVYITATGDSLIQLGGDTTNLSSDTLAERDGFLAQLRAQLNARLGTPDGGQWIAVEAAPSDTRVANSTSPATTPVNQFGPYNAYRNSGGTITQRRAMALQSAGMSITFNVVGRYLDVEIWENAGTYVGTATWTVDGGGGGTINSNGGGGATDTYRTVRLDLGTDAAHTVVISWASGNTMITGATVTRGRGVVTRRFGYGGSKASTWVGLTAKQTRTSFQTLTTHLHIIRFSYNDWNNQVADGLTIAQFQANIQTLINAALANASVKAVLLVADPATSSADNKPISYRAFADAMKALAVGQVAFFDVDAATNSTFAAGNSAGYYVDFVHRSGGGYGAETRALAEVLTSSSLLAV
ncbi:hypothetical protein MW290_25505 [Aquincola tertiaricarbonis]|uniref:SGNH hydrolase-type esterase domain-containing protein n=1 Tax=Aquincola tertiaricarbonis TaxID=391953 RepID=A0ABY4SB14_AQUTE|nr:hypothetical protein [Aquincola tertiaricarbonis]URI08928.1 hypothetical protein MW290_25505 [Aquincola tertiaricarbonis]